jgi:hypothetical protein
MSIATDNILLKAPCSVTNSHNYKDVLGRDISLGFMYLMSKSHNVVYAKSEIIFPQYPPSHGRGGAPDVPRDFAEGGIRTPP